MNSGCLVFKYVSLTDNSARLNLFLFFSGIALFVMNRPDAKNAISKNFLRMVRITTCIM